MKGIFAAVIQAGGKGTRLRKLTKGQIPKPMAILSGKPILEWQIDNLRKYGIIHIIIITGHLGNQIEQYFGDGSRWDVAIEYIQETEPLGSAGALFYLNMRNIGEDFFLIFSDIMFDVDLNRMETFHKEKRALATLLAHPNDHPYDSDLIVLNQDKQIVSFISKDVERKGWYDNCVNAGIYILSKQMIEGLSSLKKLDLEKDILFPRIRYGKVYGYQTPEYAKDAGTEQRFYEVEKACRDGILQRKNLSNPQKCIFLDRDGTVNKYCGLIDKDELLVLEQNAAEAIRRINRSDYLVIIITNQPVVARGMCEMKDVDTIHRKLKTLLGQQGAYIDDIVFCPHHPDKGYPEERPEYKIICKCRKPAIGMIQYMVDKYHIDTSQSYMIGDSTLDVQTGINAGLKTILLHSGQAGKDGKYHVCADKEAEDLLEAVQMILENKV